MDVAGRSRAGRVVVVVSESVVLAFLLGSITIHAVAAWWTAAATRHHAEVLAQSVTVIERRLDDAQPGAVDLASITAAVQEEMTATIEDVLGGIQLPTAADHMAGAVAQGFQWWIGLKQQEAMAKNPALASMLGAGSSPDHLEDTQGAQDLEA